MPGASLPSISPMVEIVSPIRTAISGRRYLESGLRKAVSGRRYPEGEARPGPLTQEWPPLLPWKRLIPVEAVRSFPWVRRVEDILAGFGEAFSKKPADLGSNPSGPVRLFSRSSPIQSDPIPSNPAHSNPVKSGPVRSDPPSQAGQPSPAENPFLEKAPIEGRW